MATTNNDNGNGDDFDEGRWRRRSESSCAVHTFSSS